MAAASHGLVRWTALIARPRRRPIRRAFNSGRAGVAPSAGVHQLGICRRRQAVHHPCHDKVAEYRRQVQEIRTAVEKISINEVREQLLETAEHLEALAREEERKDHGNSAKPAPQGVGDCSDTGSRTR